MVNSNYIKGRRKEYKIRNRLLGEGWDIVQRTAGSRSPFDVIAINRLTKVIKLVQSKPDTITSNKEDKLLSENRWLNGVFRVEFVVE